MSGVVMLGVGTGMMILGTGLFIAGSLYHRIAGKKIREVVEKEYQ